MIQHSLQKHKNNFEIIDKTEKERRAFEKHKLNNEVLIDSKNRKIEHFPPSLSNYVGYCSLNSGLLMSRPILKKAFEKIGEEQLLNECGDEKDVLLRKLWYYWNTKNYIPRDLKDEVYMKFLNFSKVQDLRGEDGITLIKNIVRHLVDRGYLRNDQVAFISRKVSESNFYVYVENNLSEFLNRDFVICNFGCGKSRYKLNTNHFEGKYLLDANSENAPEIPRQIKIGDKIVKTKGIEIGWYYSNIIQYVDKNNFLVLQPNSKVTFYNNVEKTSRASNIKEWNECAESKGEKERWYIDPQNPKCLAKFKLCYSGFPLFRFSCFDKDGKLLYQLQGKKITYYDKNENIIAEINKVEINDSIYRAIVGGHATYLDITKNVGILQNNGKQEVINLNKMMNKNDKPECCIFRVKTLKSESSTEFEYSIPEASLEKFQARLKLNELLIAFGMVSMNDLKQRLKMIAYNEGHPYTSELKVKKTIKEVFHNELLSMSRKSAENAVKSVVDFLSNFIINKKSPTFP